MANPYAINPAAPHILPLFITAPGESDVVLIGCAIFLLFVLFCVGTLYFRLHALPEHLAHGKTSNLQFEIISLLALIALFTHTGWLWIVALLLALIPIPDFHAPMETMAGALSRIASWRRPLPPDPPSPPGGTEDAARAEAGLNPPHASDASQPDMPKGAGS